MGTRIGKKEYVFITGKRKNKSVVLDFSGVTFIDKEGERMLEGIQDERVEIINCTPSIGSLLGNLIIDK